MRKILAMMGIVAVMTAAPVSAWAAAEGRCQGCDDGHCTYCPEGCDCPCCHRE